MKGIIKELIKKQPIYKNKKASKKLDAFLVSKILAFINPFEKINCEAYFP
jgi:hypothetical protein